MPPPPGTLHLGTVPECLLMILSNLWLCPLPLLPSQPAAQMYPIQGQALPSQAASHTSAWASLSTPSLASHTSAHCTVAGRSPWILVSKSFSHLASGHQRVLLITPFPLTLPPTPVAFPNPLYPRCLFAFPFRKLDLSTLLAFRCSLADPSTRMSSPLVIPNLNPQLRHLF